jgi:hypothetical protein
MSLTVAATTLDTAWTELSTIEFTASTLGTMSDMIEEVEDKLKRGTLGASTTPSDADVNKWLIRAKEELAEVKNFTWRRRYVTAPTVADQYRYSLPPDYGGGRLRIRDVTNDRAIQVWNAAIFDTKYPDPSEESSSEPRIGCVKGRELWLVPPPGGVYTLELAYDRTGDDITAADISWLPEIERFRCCDFATAEAFYSLHDYDKGDRYYNRWREGLGKAIRADGKRKWARMGFQAISGLQHNAALNYQPDER